MVPMTPDQAHPTALFLGYQAEPEGISCLCLLYEQLTSQASDLVVPGFSCKEALVRGGAVGLRLAGLLEA